jgi:hypothetical protein
MLPRLIITVSASTVGAKIFNSSRNMYLCRVKTILFAIQNVIRQNYSAKVGGPTLAEQFCTSTRHFSIEFSSLVPAKPLFAAKPRSPAFM